tara:strand:+ start:2748 stop:2903 length:156 start_codon:yes stop_codon:yes gene_type:complete
VRVTLLEIPSPEIILPKRPPVIAGHVIVISDCEMIIKDEVILKRIPKEAQG